MRRRESIPAELKRGGIFVEWYLEIMEIVRSRVGCELLYHWMQHQEEVQPPPPLDSCMV